jgi:putative PIN family toxin of toxin-antitoxin system
MFNAVYDTNVVVSGLISANGIPALLLDLAFNGRVAIFVSSEIFDEYERVVSRPKLQIPKIQREAVLKKLRSLAQWVEPRQRVTASIDPDDNRFLECAAAGEVDFLVTGNLRHFPKTFRGTRVVSPRQFFEIFWRASVTE